MVSITLTKKGAGPVHDLAPRNDYSFVGSNFIDTAEMPQWAFVELVERAQRLKEAGFDRSLLAGKVVGMVFFNPSLRTKTSLASGVARLGGTALDLAPGSYTFEFEDGVVMDGATQEHIKEAAPCWPSTATRSACAPASLITRAAPRPTRLPPGPRRARTRWCAASPNTRACR